MANSWTPERRARQAALIRTWRPWKGSTGPKSEAGKAVVAGNAWKGGTRQMLRELARALAARRDALDKVVKAEEGFREQYGAQARALR